MRLGWLDPSLSSDNSGDQIIAEAVWKLLQLAEVSEVVRLPTQRLMTREEKRKAATCERFVVGGTNLLNANYLKYRQWRLDPSVIRILRGKVLLCGVGWWQYEAATRPMTARLWRHLLSADGHSVRDEYTLKRLNAMDIAGINTGCPTMWELPRESTWQRSKENVVITLTDYNRSPELDAKFVSTLSDYYDRIFLWPQGASDREYVGRLAVDINLLSDGVDSFNEILASGTVDYVGTRLHAGVRALQYGVKSSIVAVDNRATEISRDTGLPIIPRSSIVQGVAQHHARNSLSLRMPTKAIAQWRADFLHSLGS